MDPCDILLIIPLREEFDILCTCCEIVFLEKQEGIYFYSLQLPGCSYKITCTYIGRTGPTPAGVVTTNAIEHCHPRLVMLIGIGGALDRDLLLGDVVVADEINEFQADEKVTQEAGVDVHQHAGRNWHLPDRWTNCFSNLHSAEPKIFEGWQEEIRKIKEDLHLNARQKKFTHDSPGLEIGHIASGDIVGASQSFSKQLLEINRKFRVLEMEAAGVAEACNNRSKELELIVIRGISDFADERKSKLDKIKKGVFRRLAMVSATHLFLSVIRSNDFQDILPCPHGELPKLGKEPPGQLSENNVFPFPAPSEQFEEQSKYLNREEWLEKNGYLHDPFPRAALRAEKDPILRLPGQSIFVDPPGIDYEDLLECLMTLSSESDSFFVYGNAGVGKSTLRRQFARDLLDPSTQCRGSKILVINYTNHNYDAEEGSLDEHINRIVQLAYDQENFLEEEKHSINSIKNPVTRLDTLSKVCFKNFSDKALCVLLDNVDAQGGESPSALEAKLVTLVANRDIFDLERVRFAIFLPVSLRNHLQRYNRGLYPEYEIDWVCQAENDEDRLRELIQLRLRACVKDEDFDRRYSSVNLADLCTPDLTNIEDRLVEKGKSTGQPREMWRLGFQMLEEHFTSSPYDYRRLKTDLISIETYTKALEKARSA